MNFINTIKAILSATSNPLTPQEIRDKIKTDYPDFYGTPSQISNVDKGHYHNFDHALLAKIYSLVRSSGNFQCDSSTKPMMVSLSGINITTRPKALNSKSINKASLFKSWESRYEAKVTDILLNAEKYHISFYQAETFKGPSLYFHQRALATRNDPTSISHLEYVYATLSSWGMHRMGGGGSKMLPFEEFSGSIHQLKAQIIEAKSYDFREITETEWAILKDIFWGIKVMSSNTRLVGNSKVMHHLLPNIIPPIDREYTLDFIFGNKNIKNDIENEWMLMKAIISQFFIPIVSNPDFSVISDYWMKKISIYPWDTSTFKIVDNLVIGQKKLMSTQ
jgi:hypothetical protein